MNKETTFRVFWNSKMRYSENGEFVVYRGEAKFNEYGDMVGMGNSSNLMQYIGLNDKKNGKEIYEGDIVKALNRKYDCEDNMERHFEKFKVHYLNGCYMFGNWNAHEFFNKFTFIEVIGNTYENPDLIEKYH